MEESLFLVVPYVITVLASISTVFFKGGLRTFLPVYTIAGSLSALSLYEFKDLQSSIVQFTILILGLALTVFGFVGVFGNKVSHFTYKNIMIALGIFPWHLWLPGSIIFAVIVGGYAFSMWISKYEKIPIVRMVKKGKKIPEHDSFYIFLPAPIIISIAISTSLYFVLNS